MLSSPVCKAVKRGIRLTVDYWHRHLAIVNMNDKANTQQEV